jgi:hypothetical protein
MKEFEDINAAACPGGKYIDVDQRVADVADLDCSDLVKHK